MSKNITIGNHVIGRGTTPFVMAEAGINHNGDLQKAFEMIKVAKEAGVDAIKFQTFKVHELILDPNLTYTYQSQGKEVTESMIDLFSRYEFNREQWSLIKKECDRVGVRFLSTPQNPSDLEILLELGVDAIKVGSDDFTNLPYLKSYAQPGLPLILSCGMADMEEIRETLNTVGAMDGFPVILLYCISQYPTDVENVNLLKIKTLMEVFPNIPIGFSDHTQGALASSLAVSLGASVFEKHFTLDQNLPGPDHWFSEDPKGLGEWVKSIRTAYQMMGTSEMKPTPAEIEMRTLARRSIVAITDIQQGESLTEGNIGLMRPGNGLRPALFESLIGQNATRNIVKGSLLENGDFKK